MVNPNVMLLCRYGGRVKRLNGIAVDYEGGKTALTKTTSFVSVVELKQLVSRACGFNDGEVEISLSWMMPASRNMQHFELVSLHTPDSLATTFEFFNKLIETEFLEIIVTTKVIQSAPVPGSEVAATSATSDLTVRDDVGGTQAVPELVANAGLVDKLQPDGSARLDLKRKR